MKRKKTKFFVGGLIIFVVVGYLIYTGIREVGVYYFTISELKTKKVYNEGVRVGGKVKPGSVRWDMANMKLNFEIYDGDQGLPVFYQGIVPDAFKEDNEVLIEGKYLPEGTFIATMLLAKCPSKYKAKVSKTD